MVRHIQHLQCLTQRFREQARSHRVLCYSTVFDPNPDLCGSEPAREGADTFNIAIA